MGIKCAFYNASSCQNTDRNRHPEKTDQTSDPVSHSSKAITENDREESQSDEEKLPSDQDDNLSDKTAIGLDSTTPSSIRLSNLSFSSILDLKSFDEFNIVCDSDVVFLQNSPVMESKDLSYKLENMVTSTCTPHLKILSKSYMDVLLDIPHIIAVSTNFDKTPSILIAADLGVEPSTKSDRIVLLQSLLSNIAQKNHGLIVASISSDNPPSVELHFTDRISHTETAEEDLVVLHTHSNTRNFSRIIKNENFEVFHISPSYFK